MMLVTSLCSWLYDGDWFQMLVTESLCWRLFSLCWGFSQCIKSVINISNLSPTHLVSNIRHQHRGNPKSSYDPPFVRKTDLGELRQWLRLKKRSIHMVWSPWYGPYRMSFERYNPLFRLWNLFEMKKMKFENTKIYFVRITDNYDPFF